MKPNEIRSQDPKEIAKMIEEKRKALFDLRLKKAIGQLADLSAMGKNKRDAARMLTILREKESKA
ncbi:MAG: 50S ribosomal protein L29 [Deltaproteobacteria bacterium]|nr:50S ribosomal protein L29 [Deltaproteobacteria bacterium]MBI4223309.1 50S ribosomal protein L29 [Deltaproteobacteria bacterium]